MMTTHNSNDLEISVDHEPAREHMNSLSPPHTLTHARTHTPAKDNRVRERERDCALALPYMDVSDEKEREDQESMWGAGTMYSSFTEQTRSQRIRSISWSRDQTRRSRSSVGSEGLTGLRKEVHKSMSKGRKKGGARPDTALLKQWKT